MAISVRSDNGDVSIEDIKAYFAEVYTDNGDTSIKADFHSLVARSENGDIDVKFKGRASDFVKKEKEGGKYYEVRSTNGDTKVDFYKQFLKLKLLHHRSYRFLIVVDLNGKTIIPFYTHGGSGFGRIIEYYKRECKDSTIKDGIALRGDYSFDELEKWLENNM